MQNISPPSFYNVIHRQVQVMQLCPVCHRSHGTQKDKHRVQFTRQPPPFVTHSFATYFMLIGAWETGFLCVFFFFHVETAD